MNSPKEGRRPPDRQVALHRKQFVIDAFDRYERSLTAYALGFFGGASGNLHAARDAVQFTFMKLCQQQPERLVDRLAPWLYTVCRNRVMDELRTRQKRPQMNGSYMSEIDLSSPDPAQQAELDDFLDRLPELIRTLSDGEREVIELWAQGLKPAEIATVIGKPAGSVRVALHRGIKRLQRHPEVKNWLGSASSAEQRQTTEALDYRSFLDESESKSNSATGGQK